MGQPTAEERSMARDFVMARLAACRATLASAIDSIDLTVSHFVAPETDKRGKHRGEMLEEIDEMIGASAKAIQLAQAGWDDVDPEEGEPDEDDEEEEEGEGEEGDDGDEDDGDDDEDEED